MNLRHSAHFDDMMQHRGIEFEHVKLAMREPDSRAEAYEGKMKAIKKIGNKTIEVIYFKDAFKDKKDTYILVTAYYLD